MRTTATIGVWLFLLAVARPAHAQRCGSVEGSGGQVKYAVIRVADHDGVVRYEVVPKAELKQRRETLLLAYGAAMKVYKLKKKGVPKEEVTVFLKKPSRPKMAVIGTGFTKERATARANKLQRQYEESQKKNSIGLFSGK